MLTKVLTLGSGMGHIQGDISGLGSKGGFREGGCTCSGNVT